jgi:pilus assembly protein CpaF
LAIHQYCHLICIIGGKGGVGKSVFAANLASAFLLELKAPSLLIDVDSRTAGDQSVILGLRPPKTMMDLNNFKGSLNQQVISQYIQKHASGLHYLAGVSGPEQTLSLNAEVLNKHMATISQAYRFIIADLGNDMGPEQLSLIEGCSALLMVTSPEVLVVNQTKRAMHKLMTQTVPGDLIQVVINKASKSGLDPRAIGQSLRRPVVGIIPQDDQLAYQALQRSQPFVLSHNNTQISNAYHETVRRLTGGVLQKLKAMSRPQNLAAKAGGGSSSSSSGAETSSSPMAPKGGGKDLDPHTLLKMEIHHELIKEMDLKKDMTQTKDDPAKAKELRDKTTRTISMLVDKLGRGLSREQRSQTIKEVLDEALGLGPLEALLEDKKVSEIMVNGAKKIYIEKSGRLTLSPITFTSNQQLKNVIERIVTPLGRRIDESTPYVDARLADGSRVNAVIEPLSIDGPAVTIRKFPADRIEIEDIISFGSLTQAMADFLRICVEQGLNIVISGGTGSGKTTLLNVMSSFIPTNERIITVEDAAELQLKQDHVVRLETKPPNMEGAGEVTIRDLIKNSLRMRPDRIVVGECRDGAALDMLSAMNTGHDGSMTTVHANNPREAVSRLETLCMMAGMELPAKAIREQVASAVQLIVQIGRLSDGSRKVKSVTEVVGMSGETVTLKEIYRFKEISFDKNRKIVGQFQAMGQIPTFLEKFEARGVKIPRTLFTNNEEQGPKKLSGSSASKKPVRPVPGKKPLKPSGGGTPSPAKKTRLTNKTNH